MAKTTTVKHKFYVVDLVRSKPKLNYIEIPKYRVDVELEVTTKGTLKKPDPAPSTKLKRLEEAGMAELERYEKVITEEAVKLDAKVGKLMETPGAAAQKEAEKMIQATNASIKNAMDSAEGAAQKAIEARLKKEAQGDKLLKEARVKTTLKVGLGTIKIAGSVAKLVATSGADVTSYKTIVVEVVKLGMEINQQLKNEAKLRKDLYTGIQAYITLRGTVLMQAAERQGITDTSGISVKKPIEAIKKLTAKALAMGDEVTKGKDAKSIAKNLLDATVKGISAKVNDAEKARKAYREHTTKTRNKTDSLGVSADKLMKKVRASKTLKEGVKLGAECMTLKRAASELAAKLKDREAFLEEMQALMEGNGMKIDDQTTIQKLKELDKMSIASEATTLMGAIKTVKTLVDNVSKAVA
ncbi:hypothetical protein K3722_19755 (plasmid) [Leisingera caerulea]|uniref:Uncharacterized protein n=1 Tax=Leisingera caerulea TaxID=506591 RepID=A0ABY5X303_LEICA|nr:hypothetical protein [Leisingera caerulea]UWQ51809.1 hypothetical protein K3720_18425 [Leisingera caerulea]UWQ60746.1 hypothetical protein K3722_19755 [Leisingera caerulea]UWQ86210.1 hypothetical protein K3726_21710 [Leisingera caerulea]